MKAAKAVIRGIGGWAGWWKTLRPLARKPAFWKGAGVNGYRPMFHAETFTTKEVVDEVRPWIEAGFEVRIAMDMARNEELDANPFWLALFSRDAEACKAYGKRLTDLAKALEKLKGRVIIEPCQESEVWNYKYGLDQSKWDDAKRDWAFFCAMMKSALTGYAVDIDFGSCANQSPTGFDCPYERQNWLNPPGRSGCHIYTIKPVNAGQVVYGSAEVKDSIGREVKGMPADITMKETGGLGPCRAGVDYAVAAHVANCQRWKIPVEFTEVGSNDRRNCIDLLEACQVAEALYHWDFRSLFVEGNLDMEKLSVLVGIKA